MNAKNHLLRRFGVGFLTMCLAALMSLSVAADSYLYDTKGNITAAPDAYTITAKYDGDFSGAGKLNQPSDIFVGSNGDIAIADTGNNRVLIFDRNWKCKRIIQTVTLDGEAQTLNEPRGVFIHSDGLVYIAETGSGRIIAVDSANVVAREMTREGVAAVNENMAYHPEKVVVDTDGNVFVVDRTLYQGIVQYDSNDAFLKLYAPNEVTVTAEILFLKMWKELFNDERNDALVKTLPSPYSNLYIDSENFVYTAAYGVSIGDELKRLNTTGVNILKSADVQSNLRTFGDLEITYNDNQAVTSQFIDVHADQNGLICGADEVRGRLFLYNRDCDLIAVMDSGAQKLVAIDKLGDDYLALDSESGGVIVLSPTAYMHDVLEALQYYDNGLYTESVALWETVLQQNANFQIAYRGIGRACFQAGDNEKAIDMLKKGGDPYFYSLSMKDYRREFVRENFVWLLLGALAAATLLYFVIKLARHWMLKGKEGVQCIISRR